MLETVKIRRNENATPTFLFKYSKRMFREFYMIRMCENMGTTWKKRKNIDSVIRTGRKFRSKLSTRL